MINLDDLFFKPKSPNAATWSEWKRIDDAQRKSNPIMWFVLKTFPHVVSKHLVCPIISTYDNLLSFIINDRKHHIIFTSLDRFSYHSPETRILYATFEEFVKYVTNEYDGRYHYTLDETLSDIRKELIKTREYSKKQISMFKTQYKTVSEIKELYMWWTEQRPKLYKNLNEMYEKLNKSRPKNYDSLSMLDDENKSAIPKEHTEYSLKWDEYWKLENKLKASDREYYKKLAALIANSEYLS